MICIAWRLSVYKLRCNICVVPLLKASIRSTAPQTEQHSQLTEPLDKMPQCRKMSNVFNEGWWQFADWQVVSSDVINTTSDKINTVKWSLDLSSSANEVRAFGNVYPFTFSGFIWVELGRTGDERGVGHVVLKKYLSRFAWTGWSYCTCYRKFVILCYI